MPIPIGWGQQRLSPNCISYTGFFADWQKGSGGKWSGSTAKGSNSGAGGAGGAFHYGCTIIMSLCEGPILNFVSVYSNNMQFYFPYVSWLPVWNTAYGYLGGYTQAPLGLGEVYAGQTMAYRGQALIAGWLNLGTSSSLPNVSYELQFEISYGVPALGPCANPIDVIFDFLTNLNYGVPSFPSAVIGDLSGAKNYCTAMGLVVSPILTSATAASQFLADLSRAINCEFVWSSGYLTLVPYAEWPVSGNGASYNPSFAPIYDLTTRDFQPNKGSSGGATSGDTSVAMTIKDQSEIFNHIRVEYLPRAYGYNPDIVNAIDETSIALYGLERRSDVISMHMFCIQSAAQVSASLMLARQQIMRSFQVTVGPQFILLDPMDLVTITEPQLGLFRQAVRILEIQENNDLTLTITAEEFLGRLSSPLYGAQASMGTITNRTADPGAINAPYIFEPPYQFENALEIAIAVSGKNTAAYGGCNVWVSSDNTTYDYLGTMSGPSKMGVTTADLPMVPAAVTGPTVDNVNSLNVNLAESNSALVTSTSVGMLALSTSLFVDGEVVSYQNAVLTSPNHYTLALLVRGGYGTPIVDHPAGKPVVYLDNGVFSYLYTTDLVGSTIYFKFQPFNFWGGFRQELSEIGAIPYVITGAPLTEGLATPQNVRTVFADGFMNIWWDEITDFRPNIRYSISQGASYAGSIQVGDVAHPPFIAGGAGTYWISANVRPAIGLFAKSITPASISIAGNMLVQNLLLFLDEENINWPGTLTNLTRNGSPGSEYLTITPGQSDGTYTNPSNQTVDMGYATKTAINISWQATGSPTSQNILSLTDFLGQTDILGSSGGAFVTAWPEIAISQGDLRTDIFAVADIFDLPDIFYNWAPWQKFVPGNYFGRFFSFRMRIQCSNPNITAAILTFEITMSVPPRIDHYQNLSIPSGGLTITFKPDGTAAAVSFQGGPNGAVVPYINVSWPNTAGDTLLISGLTLSSVTIQILNGGVGVARTSVNVDAEGY